MIARYRRWRLRRHIAAVQRAGLLVTTPRAVISGIMSLRTEEGRLRRAGGGNASKLADRGKALRRCAVRMREALQRVLRATPEELAP